MAQIRWGKSVEPNERGAVYGRTAMVSAGLLVAIGSALALPPFRDSVVSPALELSLSSALAQKGPGIFWEDGEFLEQGQIIAGRDLDYLVREYGLGSHGAGAEGRLVDAAKLRATVEEMRHARARWAQASLFQCVNQRGVIRLKPYDWTPVKADSTRLYDIVIVGGELSSISTAVAAADMGYRVGLVVAGPLGGLSSDTGGNMRYFDYYPPTPRPAAQQRIFRSAFDAYSRVTIPPDTSARLSQFLQSRYAGRIEVIPTQSYDSMTVEKGSDEISGIVLAEGVRVAGKRYLDMDPECRVGEKAGVEIDVDAPILSYGMVFDASGLDEATWAGFGDFSRYSPEAIMAQCGLTENQVRADANGAKVLESLRRHRAADRVKVFPDFRYGYSGLAEGFHFSMVCREIAGDRSPQLVWLNQRRVTSGFNVATYGDQGTFNSVSYRLNRSILQHSHSLGRDAQFAPIREVEIPALQEYLRWASGNSRLKVRMPEQLYVRRSTAFFMTLNPMRRHEENTKGSGLFTCYSMDLRDVTTRDEIGAGVVNSYIDEARHVTHWPNRASMSATRFRNLHLINKCSATPRYSGGMRIEQNQVNQGITVIRQIAKEMPASASP